VIGRCARKRLDGFAIREREYRCGCGCFRRSWSRLRPKRSMNDFETIAQEVSALGGRVLRLEERLDDVERVNARLEEAALTTARALEEVSGHWDALYEAIRRRDRSQEDPA
jgi:hypothetical protein